MLSDMTNRGRLSSLPWLEFTSVRAPTERTGSLPPLQFERIIKAFIFYIDVHNKIHILDFIYILFWFCFFRSKLKTINIFKTMTYLCGFFAGFHTT